MSQTQQMLIEIANEYVKQLNALKDNDNTAKRMENVIDDTVDFFLSKLDEQFPGGADKFVSMWACVLLAEYMSILPAGTLLAEVNANNPKAQQHNDETIEIIRNIFASILVARLDPNDYEQVIVVTKNGFTTKEKKPWSYQSKNPNPV